MKYFISPDAKIEKANTVNKKKLKANGFYEKAIIFSNAADRVSLGKKVQNGDILECHGHGLPSAYGAENDANNDLSPFQFAVKLEAIFRSNPDIELIIDLRFCESSTTSIGPFGNINYAESLSKSLNILGLKNIKVYGYRASLSDNVFKQSAGVTDSYQGLRGSKKPHASLEDVRDVYLCGELIEAARKDFSQIYKSQRIHHSVEDFTFVTYYKHKLTFEEVTEKVIHQPCESLHIIRNSMAGNLS